ncbi:hypothetical protein HN358_04525 [Candidatus Uhrbacteria bacterium]|nr:hypothetical protein [Candidatus Uhrbacteria bacterium]
MSFKIVGVKSLAELEELLCTKGEDEQILAVNLTLTSIQKFFAAFVAAVVAAFDFDGTVTAHSQFTALRNNTKTMTRAMAEEDEADAMSYFGGGILSDYGHISFIFRTVRRMLSARLDRNDFREAVTEIKPRPGAIELMQTFLPRMAGAIAIISYGLWDVIRIWTDFYAYHVVRSDAIHALKLDWKRDMLDGCQLTTVVSDGNKGHRFAVHCALNEVEPKTAIVIGDSPITDLSMLRMGIGVLLIPNTEKVLRNIKKQEAEMRADHRVGPFLAPAFMHVQAFFLSDDLTPLAKIRLGEITCD